jgi:hypothetical protein
MGAFWSHTDRKAPVEEEGGYLSTTRKLPRMNGWTRQKYV